MANADAIERIRRQAGFQDRVWRLQRLAWVLLLAIVAAGSFGLFAGGGPLSRASAAASGISLNYPRIARSLAPFELELEIGQDASGEAHADHVDVHLSRDYADGIEIREVMPRPVAEWSTGEGIVLRIAAAGGTTRLRIDGRATSAGWLRGSLRVGESEVELTTFVYP